MMFTIQIKRLVRHGTSCGCGFKLFQTRKLSCSLWVFFTVILCSRQAFTLRPFLCNAHSWNAACLHWLPLHALSVCLCLVSDVYWQCMYGPGTDATPHLPHSLPLRCLPDWNSLVLIHQDPRTPRLNRLR